MVGSCDKRSRTLQPADIQVGHGAHALRVRGVALLEHGAEAAAHVARVVEVFRLWESGVPLQDAATCREH